MLTVDWSQPSEVILLKGLLANLENYNLVCDHILLKIPVIAFTENNGTNKLRFILDNTPPPSPELCLKSNFKHFFKIYIPFDMDRVPTQANLLNLSSFFLITIGEPELPNVGQLENINVMSLNETKSC